MAAMPLRGFISAKPFPPHVLPISWAFAQSHDATADPEPQCGDRRFSKALVAVSPGVFITLYFMKFTGTRGYRPFGSGKRFPLQSRTTARTGRHVLVPRTVWSISEKTINNSQRICAASK